MKHLFYNTIANVLPFLMGTRNRQRLSILNYHRIVLERDFMRPSEPTLPEFTWQMELLSKYFNPLPLSKAVDLMADGELPEKAVCVTFDDGYSDNESLALPVLKRLGVPATVYVTTDYLNGGLMWNDAIIEIMRIAKGPTLDLAEAGLGVYSIENEAERRQAADTIIKEVKHQAPEKRVRAIDSIEAVALDGILPSNLMMTDEQVRNLSANGIDIGAHTLTHPILAKLSLSEAKKEIEEPKGILEKLTGKQVTSFAYPNGRPEIDYQIKDRDLTELAGYKYAVSTNWGVATRNSDFWQLPRFTPWDRSPLRFLIRLLLNFRNTV